MPKIQAIASRRAIQVSVKSGSALLELIIMDIYDFKGKQHLVIADAYSGFCWSERTKTILSADVIMAMESFFSLVGYPCRLRCDNRRQLVSEETKSYLKKHGVTQEMSSPKFSSSNGHSEAAVKVAKMLQRKCMEEKSNFISAFVELQWQPKSDGEIPSDLFFSNEKCGVS